MALYFADATRPDDTGNGLTLAAAKKTIQAAVNLGTVPGDIVEVSSGTYRELVLGAGVGAPGNPITLRAAANATVIITGADNMTGFTNGGANIWDKTAVTTQPNIVVIIGTRPKNMAASRVACTTVGDWFWAANVLSVFAASDPAGTVEVGQRDFCIDTNDKADLTYIGMTLKHANKILVLTESGCFLAKLGSTRTTIINMTILEGAGIGLGLYGPNTSLIINGLSATWCGSNGCYLDTGFVTTDISLLNSDFSNNGWRTGLSAGYDGGCVMKPGSGEIAFSRFTNNGAGNPGATTEHGLYFNATAPSTITVHHSYFGFNLNGRGFKCDCSATVYRNIVEGNREGMGCEQNGAFNIVTVFHHNTYFNNVFSGLVQQNKGAGTVSLSLYDETFYNTIGTTSGYEIRMTDSLTVLNIQNCILFCAPTRGCVKSTAAQAGTVNIDYNLHWRADGNPNSLVNAVTLTWATWQALGYDAHGKNLDPLFVGPTGGNYRLLPTSPAIDGGLIQPGYSYRGTAPDMGAYELGAPEAGTAASVLGAIFKPTDASLVTLSAANAVGTTWIVPFAGQRIYLAGYSLSFSAAPSAALQVDILAGGVVVERLQIPIGAKARTVEFGRLIQVAEGTQVTATVGAAGVGITSEMVLRYFIA